MSLATCCEAIRAAVGPGARPGVPERRLPVPDVPQSGETGSAPRTAPPRRGGPLRAGRDTDLVLDGATFSRHRADSVFPERLEWRRRVNAILFHE